MNFTFIMHFIVAHVIAIYFWFESIFRFFFPRQRKNVKGEVVLITGAGSGLGQKLSIEFAKLGCIIAGWDISNQGLKQTERELKKLGLSSQWHSYICDISDRHKVYEAAEKVTSEIGSVTILINNAGIVTGKHFNECSDELMLKTMEVNAIAHFWTIKAFLPAMIEKDKGHIVTVASAAGLFGTPGLVDYCASKFAAVGLAESLHIELNLMKKSGIKSTVVCPFYIDTGMFDGVTSPILPIIKLDDATDRIVDAVLRDKFWLIMPRAMYFLYGARGILPNKTAFVLGKAAGLIDCMTTFVGRRKSK